MLENFGLFISFVKISVLSLLPWFWSCLFSSRGCVIDAYKWKFLFKKSFFIIMRCPLLSMLVLFASGFFDLLDNMWRRLCHMTSHLSLFNYILQVHSCRHNFTDSHHLLTYSALTLPWRYLLKQGFEMVLYFWVLLLDNFDHLRTYSGQPGWVTHGAELSGHINRGQYRWVEWIVNQLRCVASAYNYMWLRFLPLLCT